MNNRTVKRCSTIWFCDSVMVTVRPAIMRYTVTAFICRLAVSIYHSSHELKSIEWQNVSPQETISATDFLSLSLKLSSTTTRWIKMIWKHKREVLYRFGDEKRAPTRVTTPITPYRLITI